MLKNARVGGVRGVLGKSRVPLKSRGRVVGTVEVVLLEHGVLVVAQVVGRSSRSRLGLGSRRRRRSRRLRFRDQGGLGRRRRRRRSRRRRLDLDSGLRGGRRSGSRGNFLGLDKNCSSWRRNIFGDGDGNNLGFPGSNHGTLLERTSCGQQGAGGHEEH